MKFGEAWRKKWMKDYKISLRKPNKRYALSREVRKRRVLNFLKNIYRVRSYFIKTHGKEPAIISADQMPLHRLESSGEKTLSQTGSDCNEKKIICSPEKELVHLHICRVKTKRKGHHCRSLFSRERVRE